MTHLTMQARSALRAFFIFLAATCLPTAETIAAGSDTATDPLASVQWPALRKDYFGTAVVSFDARVKVSGPRFADDAMNVPIAVDASELVADGEQVLKMVVIVERNPIRKVLEFEPRGVLPRLTFRFKLEQASPVRVAVLDQRGKWHIGSAQVDASGGGCTVAGATRSDGSWNRTLNQVQTRYFRDIVGGNSARLRLRVMHPMDTGLVAGIPAFHIERITLETDAGQALLNLSLYEPVSENPTFSFDFSTRPTAVLRLTGADNNGNRILAEVAP